MTAATEMQEAGEADALVKEGVRGAWTRVCGVAVGSGILGFADDVYFAVHFIYFHQWFVCFALQIVTKITE